MSFRAAAAGAMLMLVAGVALSAPLRRLIVVVGQPDDPRVAQERGMLARSWGPLDERDVVVQSLTPEAARRDRPDLGVAAATAFEVLLVGKDGGVKLRRQSPVAPSEFSRLIDTMPMRRQEMKP